MFLPGIPIAEDYAVYARAYDRWIKTHSQTDAAIAVLAERVIIERSRATNHKRGARASIIRMIRKIQEDPGFRGTCIDWAEANNAAGYGRLVTTYPQYREAGLL